MDDLLTRLRRPAGAGMTGESAQAMADAAAEIKRVRAIARDAISLCNQGHPISAKNVALAILKSES